MTTVLLLVVTPYILVDVYQCCGGYCHLKVKDIFKSRQPKRYTDQGLGVEKGKAILGLFNHSVLLLP
jgi:hypothetical protein